MSAVQVEALWAGLHDSNGEPLSGGLVYTYSAGTTNKKATYTDRAKNTEAANPIVLDSAGKAQVYADGSYKFVVKTAAGVTLDTLDDLYYAGASSQDTPIWCDLATGTANALVATPSPALAAYTDGLALIVLAAYDNSTAAPTINVSGLGAKTIKSKLTTETLGVGEIKAGQPLYLIYDSGADVFVLTNPYIDLQTVQDATMMWGGTSGGSANAQTITVTPAPTAYANGQVFRFYAGYTNTGALTLNVNGLGAVTVTYALDGLNGGEVRTGGTYEVIYSAPYFILVNPDPVWQTYVPTVTGFSVNPTVITGRYKISGATCTVVFACNGGTSNAASFTVTLPFTSSSALGSGYNWTTIARVQDNGSFYWGGVIAPHNSNVATLGKESWSAGFLDSGYKGAEFTLVYEIA